MSAAQRLRPRSRRRPRLFFEDENEYDDEDDFQAVFSRAFQGFPGILGSSAVTVIAGQSGCAESIYTADWLSSSHKDSACKRLPAVV